MWIPDWLYERLPLFYVACGIACLWALGLTLAGLPSALLFAAAVRIYTWRRSARQAALLRASRRPSRRRGG